MDPMAVIEKYYPSGSALHRILVDHSRQVAEKSLEIARNLADPDLDLLFIEQAALLHDIGIFLTASPKLGCTGEAPYVCHGYLGRELLDNEGLNPAYGRVAERHTGAGICLATIQRHNLPLPRRDMVPVTLAEKIICCADKFFSKTGPARHRPRTVSQILGDLNAIDPAHARRFARWAWEFRL
ncbi:MAG: HD domain-containing protein [Desulfotignum sp.]|nr:HD domain-containing protein [Desulfotignum sp.]MCF8089323.1 HD domain-containing protein [Desulfotignum sp.]MCF8138847.1 HD domain-containing protein [Desulfotignum sp.]